jgi:hypothetical protein
MANVYSIHSVGDSLITFLRDTYPEPLRTQHPCEFGLISSGELRESDDMGTAVTLYLYRVEIDKHTRNTPLPQRPGATPFPLSVCLYYLFIIWADSALVENTIAAWVMSQIHQHPILDQSTLSSTADWEPDDQINIVPMEMTNEDLMRLWDAVSPTYRLSLPYLARVVRIHSEADEEGRLVVATRYVYGDIENGNEATEDQGPS